MLFARVKICYGEMDLVSFLPQKTFDYVTAEKIGEVNTEYYPFQFYENENKTYGLALIELDKVACYIRDINPVIDGNGYDWEDVIKTYLKEKHADRKHKVKFDSEADMMYMYSRDKELMKSIAMDLSNLVNTGEIKSYVMHTKFKDYD